MTATQARKIAATGVMWASLLAGAGFDTARWMYRTPVQVLEQGRLGVIPFDRTLYSRMRPDLADLRIVKDGDEVPYLIETKAGSVEQRECHAEIVNRSAIRDAGVQITLDLTKCSDEPRHSRIRFGTTETNFRQKVRVETSDDNRFWAIAREDGYIFDFTQGDKKLSVLTVDYPVSTRRYVRATVFGWTSAGAVTEAWSAFRVVHPAEYYIIDAITPARSEDEGARSSLLTLDLGQTGLPHSRLRLEVDNSSFHRGVEVEASEDTKSWRMVTRGTLFQVSEEQSLAISFPEIYDRYLRLRIFNGDNRPVPVLRVYIETLQRFLKFLPSTDGEYWMYYGNPDAKAPVYDLAAILSRQTPALETIPMVGEWQRNADYRSPADALKPWSEKHPVVLYGVLGAAILIMGLMTVRFLVKVRG